MEIVESHEFFRKFPYKSDYNNGRTNNGGIDLLQKPGDIEQISEAREFPPLRNFLLSLNAPTSPYMTLGCDCGMHEGHYYTYLQFSYRALEIAQNKPFMAGVDLQFDDWLPRQVPGMEAMAQGMCRSIVWESHLFQYYETEPRLMITMHCKALDQANAALLIGWIQKFLIEYLALQTP